MICHGYRGFPEQESVLDMLGNCQARFPPAPDLEPIVCLAVQEYPACTENNGTRTNIVCGYLRIRRRWKCVLREQNWANHAQIGEF